LPINAFQHLNNFKNVDSTGNDKKGKILFFIGWPNAETTARQQNNLFYHLCTSDKECLSKVSFVSF